ncbi:MAG: metal dependent phosphohydrolase [Sphingomonas bacterium]|jgi:HD-GYP domain-containing protein (c-di-GMP phosphodiesterase class II)|uniref:HD-GYP domain-containing protein n=1 Tax=Sphingomonas bacterium TaxID=1895847 RepID=UPI00260C0CFE|nr:HD-GYP domain-containing protein [Sphingomonas bacterium]MDB5705129.1 metal dependent phosphohydrolase [Sphingomonas bacterium]
MKDPLMDVLNGEDWRHLGEGSAEQVVTPASSRVHRAKNGSSSAQKEQPCSPSDERRRAQDIVAAAKEAVATTFQEARFGRRINVAALEPIVDAIAGSIARSPLALPSVVRLKDRHEYTYLHSIAVCGMMIGLAQELDLDPCLIRRLGLAGLMHDVGKARVPLSVLDKPGPLDLEEYALIHRHTTRGHEILVDAGIDCAITLDVCLNHHERLDGRGYPAGLSSASISVYARMAAVCDVYDATTSARSYKAGWSPGEALEWMMAAEGHFDPRVLRAFRRMIGIFPLGSLVRLASDRLAVVLSDDAGSATPKVGAFLCAISRKGLTPCAVDTVHDPIVSLELPGRWGLTDWALQRDHIMSAF